MRNESSYKYIVDIFGEAVPDLIADTARVGIRNIVGEKALPRQHTLLRGSMTPRLRGAGTTGSKRKGYKLTPQQKAFRRKRLRSARVNLSKHFGDSPTPAQYQEAQMNTPAAANAAIHQDTVSSITTKTVESSALQTALALNSMFGKPSKKVTTLSKQKRSKYCSAAVAYKMALKSLCPKIHLKMHQIVTTNMQCSSGVQAVYSSMDTQYCFPLKQLLAQVHYKLGLDLTYPMQGQALRASNGATAATNQYIPIRDASLLPGGSLQTAAGYANLPSLQASRTYTADDYKYNNIPGLIMKYYKRMYTFMNTGTTPVHLQVYEFIKNDGRDGEQSPQTCWTRSLLEISAANVTGDAIVYPNSTFDPSITKLGEVPRKSYKELSDYWRHHKITSYTIDPQQSLIHTAYLPGCYYTARDIYQDDSATLVKNKSMAVMFVLNGALAFEGGNPTANEGQGVNNAVIGTAGGFLNYKIESEAVFQGIPQSKSYTRFVAHEDLVTQTNQSNVLLTPQIMVPQAFERIYESAMNADRSGIGGTSDGAKVTN